MTEFHVWAVVCTHHAFLLKKHLNCNYDPITSLCQIGGCIKSAEHRGYVRVVG